MHPTVQKSHNFILQIAKNVSDKTRRKSASWQEDNRTKAGGLEGGTGSFERQESMSTTSKGTHTFKPKISPIQGLQKRRMREGPVRA